MYNVLKKEFFSKKSLPNWQSYGCNTEDKTYLLRWRFKKSFPRHQEKYIRKYMFTAKYSFLNSNEDSLNRTMS